MGRITYQDTKAKFIVRKERLQKTHEQLLAAVTKARSSGICPLIKDHRTINTALKKGVQMQYSGRKDSLLHIDEEMTLVAYISIHLKRMKIS